MKHGWTGYLYYGCRCATCTAANTEAGARGRRARYERLARQPQLAPHGEESTYTNWGCRCEKCKEAHRVHAARTREGTR